jgi:hypothetical protein
MVSVFLFGLAYFSMNPVNPLLLECCYGRADAFVQWKLTCNRIITRHLIIRHIGTHVDKAIQMDTKLHFIVSCTY